MSGALLCRLVSATLKFALFSSLVSGFARAEVIETQDASFTVETVADGLTQPWSMAFFPEGEMIVLEKVGAIRKIDSEGNKSDPFSGLPAIAVLGQGGLLDIELDPDYAVNGWVYLVYSAPHPENKRNGMTTVARCRFDLENLSVTDFEVLYQPALETFSRRPHHFGSRVVFDHAGMMFFSIGDRGEQRKAQNLDLPHGKVFRLNRDGSIPGDNPFLGDDGALPEMYSYGHRNPQGLAVHPVTGDVWAVEHGPRGGDELNLLKPGANYGWPLITYGINYNGTPITDKTSMPGMEQPLTYWDPSIAPCGMGYYTGDQFPEWKHDLFIAALAHRKLTRLVFADDGRTLEREEIMLEGIGRIRDFESGPEGLPYLILNAPNSIVRLVPAN